MVCMGLGVKLAIATPCTQNELKDFDLPRFKNVNLKYLRRYHYQKKLSQLGSWRLPELMSFSLRYGDAGHQPCDLNEAPGA